MEVIVQGEAMNKAAREGGIISMKRKKNMKSRGYVHTSEMKSKRRSSE